MLIKEFEHHQPEVLPFLPAAALLHQAENTAKLYKKEIHDQKKKKNTSKKTSLFTKNFDFLPKLFKKKLNKQPIGPTENYLRRFFPNSENGAYQLEPATTDEERAEILQKDVEHIVREMLRVEKETTFTITVSAEKQASYGEAYGETMSFMLANFAYEISKQGLLASRAVLEHLVFQRAHHQLLEIAQDYIDQTINNLPENEREKIHFVSNKATLRKTPPTTILISSPPGLAEHGYHGINSLTNWNNPEWNHSFHFGHLIDEIEVTLTEDGKILVTKVLATVHQFRTWHNIQNLLDLHSSLGSGIAVDKKIPITNQIIANAQKLVFAEKTSQDEQDGVEEGTSRKEILAFLRKKLYEGQEHWARNPEQAPQLSPENETAFWEELGVLENKKTHQKEELAFSQEAKRKKPTFFNEIYLKPILRLLRETDPNTLTNLSVRQQLIDRLNLRTKAFSQAVELRIRELNTNPQFTDLVKKRLLLEGLKNPHHLPAIIEQIENLTQNKTTLPLNETKRLSTTKYSYILLEKRTILKTKLSEKESIWLAENYGKTFALGGFAFGSMQCLTIGSLQLPLKALSLENNPGFQTTFEEALAKVDIAAKQDLLKEIKAKKYVEVDLRPQANSVWMVPSSYLSGLGCRVNEVGMVCGPCITDEFPLGIPFDHPLEQVNPYGPLCMNQASFNEYIKKIELSIIQDQIGKKIDIDKMPEKDKKYTQSLIDRIIKSLIKVNLTTLIAGVTDYYDHAALLPAEKLAQITSIAALEQLVLELEEKDSNEELAEFVAISTQDPSAKRELLKPNFNQPETSVAHPTSKAA